MLPPSDKYFIVEANQALEIWWDWDPIVDGSPFEPAQSFLSGLSLYVETSSGHRRHFVLHDDVAKDVLTHPCHLVVCNSIGIISRRPTSIKTVQD